MERIKSLNRYQKMILFLMFAMTIVFSVVYPAVISKEGFAYKGAILIPSQENGNTIYSGKIHGEPASFTVYPDKSVEFQYGYSIYGPYTAIEDPAAIPVDSELGDKLTGIELRCEDEIVFRGGVLDSGGHRWLYNEDGSAEDLAISVTIGGVRIEKGANGSDPLEPSASTILDLMAGPELTHKGVWFALFCGIFVCIVTMISILFADELFRWHLIFIIKNAADAEPSDWELAGRYITWTVLPVVALVLFIVGLQ